MTGYETGNQDSGHLLGAGVRLVFEPTSSEQSDEQPLQLPDDTVLLIGRSPKCQVVIPRQFRLVSKVHAAIEPYGSRYLLRDRKSTNGTFLNGARLYEPAILEDGDQIGLGNTDTMLQFIDPDPDIDTTYIASPLSYNDLTRTFFWHQTALVLSPHEHYLLQFLHKHMGAVCDREACARAVWGQHYAPGLDAAPLDRVVANLRKKLREVDPEATRLLQTRRGQGYQLLQNLLP